MATSTLNKKFSKLVIGAAAIAAGTAFASAGTANAAMFAVGDAGRWGTGGENTLSNLGFNMVSFSNNPAVPGGFTPVNQISSPSNTISFSNTVYKAYVGTDWAKLQGSRFNNGSAVYFNGGPNTTTFSFAKPVSAFDFIVETNSLAPIVFNLTVKAFGGVSETLTQGLQGNVGGKYFGFYTTGTDLISSITIAAPSGAEGFAMGEFRLSDSKKDVPEPASALGLLALGAIGTGSMLKGKRQQKSSVKA